MSSGLIPGCHQEVNQFLRATVKLRIPLKSREWKCNLALNREVKSTRQFLDRLHFGPYLSHIRVREC